MDATPDGQAPLDPKVARRRAAVPTITYPEELPVSQRRDDLLAAIRDHQVVIVAGETGSGKTTQLPKMCLELGRGVHGLIGHTQPRRLAARTVAHRIAEELGTELGDVVGYQVRFSERVSDDTLVKVMTDGILLTEIQRDRSLRRYDTLIIDEAHERSLNIDFILGYLKRLLPRRPDLKVIITSATIDPERFSEHFASARGGEAASSVGGAPIIEVSGRTYPVEVRYRPIEDDTDQVQAVCDAVTELSTERPGDILVFLSGEREIRDTADALRGMSLRNCEILPLYARLSTAEQYRVFQSHPGRRIVLATNVAETSLTVPGIRYVIDPGTARISRYSNRLKVQRLPIEAISQASANQRKGRCGRTSDGVCVRLYSEQDFGERPEFTDPEILRTNLASVILQMAALGVGGRTAGRGAPTDSPRAFGITEFPFIDPPDRRNIIDGFTLLHELGALHEHRLTPLGRKLARLPVDPRLARMVLEADRNGCVHDVLIIVAALSIQDPRERPTDRQEAATQQHARFADPDSDFVALLNLWRYLEERQRALSSSQFRKLCRTEFLNYLRVREWQDLYGQLRTVVKGMGITARQAETPAQAIHTSLLAGLLSHIGVYDSEKRDYLGARGARFGVFPGSALFRKSPRWIMAAELVETSRLWARVVARIEPEWVEGLAEHLVKRSYSEPHWEKKQGAVMAYEKVTLYGVPIVAARKVNYGRIDPKLSRELFIRHALVDGDWHTDHAFFRDNLALLDEVENLEHRARRRDILVDDEALFDFYDQRIGAEVVSAQHFDSWWKQTRRGLPDLLTFSRSMLIQAGAGNVAEQDYPEVWRHGDIALRLSYQFEPGTDADGVTVHIPLPLLSRVDGTGFDWQVPGLREELVTALIRGLPKPIRRELVPVPDHARAVLAGLTQGSEPLVVALEHELRRLVGVTIPYGAWQPDRVPDHLRMTFRVEDADGTPLAEGKDLAELKVQLTDRVRATVSAAAGGIEQAGLRAWSGGPLPRSVTQQRAGHPMTVYPALVDQGDSVAIRALGTEPEQQRAMWRGTGRLLLLNLPAPATFLQGRLSNADKLALSRNPHRNAVDLLDDCAGCAVDALMAANGGPAWDAAGFDRLRDAVRAGLVDAVVEVVGNVRQILAVAHDIEQRLSGATNPMLLPALTDIRSQLDHLVYRGFVTDTGWRHLPELPRYLRAILRRLEKLPENPARDRERMLRVAELRRWYDELRESLPPATRDGDAVREIRWMLEELRVNFFAQALGNPYPISDKRILRAMDEVAP